MTKEEVKEKILEVLSGQDKAVNPAVITQKLGWNKETINECCDLFGCKSFNELLSSFPECEVKKDANNTPSVCLKDKLPPPPDK